MCDHTPRESAMVVVRRAEDGTPMVWCDPCIEPLVRALNDAGLATVASCCGHGRQPGNIALADGRELVIARTYAEARAIERVRVPTCRRCGAELSDQNARQSRGRFVGACRACESIEGSVDDLLTPEQRKALTADLREISARRRRATDAAATIPLGSVNGNSSPRDDER